MSTNRKTMIELGAGDSTRSLTPEEIKFRDRIARSEPATWVSPNHGDGGWHTTPGMQLYTTEWQPLRDRILVQLFDEPMKIGRIHRPEMAAAFHEGTRRGIVLKVGPGRWIDGYFYKLDVKPGEEIVIGRWADWESADAGWGQNVVICQEADIRVIVNREKRCEN